MEIVTLGLNEEVRLGDSISVRFVRTKATHPDGTMMLRKNFSAVLGITAPREVKILRKELQPQ